DTPIIWRGPLRSKAISQFLRDVNWGELDFLIADLPPGTGDEVLTIAQRMEPDLAVVVTTPQEVSVLDCRRAIALAKKMKTRYIGVIENMSGLRCPKCGAEIEIFGSGGGMKLAGEMGVGFLGKIPIEVATRKSSDEGKPIVLSNKDSDVSKAIFSIIDKIVTMFY
ncbi:P-loop NTPase, partial [candidate division WOR-3 bacterium]|nr:P-loop NTPase [candidate division WOR-3 bacterium]